MPEPPASPRPLLVIVRGKPGAGKTTLARRLAEPDALGLPLLSRDAIKAGLVATRGVETNAVRATVIPQAFDLFHRTIELWLREGVSLIAEEAFTRARAEPALRVFAELADTVVITCDTSDEEAARRYIEREDANPWKRPDVLAATVEQMRSGAYPWRIFDAFDLGVPALCVDTTDGYKPGLEEIVAFCRAGGGRDAVVREPQRLPAVDRVES
jgi:predicted kinase